MEETKNAKIEGVSLEIEDHGILTAWLQLDFGDGGHQAFGGYGLYYPRDQSKSLAGKFIYRTLEVLGVRNWDNLQGMIVRVKRNDGLVVSVGHPIKDEWFTPSVEFK
jgi:hypothetical protein